MLTSGIVNEKLVIELTPAVDSQIRELIVSVLMLFVAC